MVWKAYKIIDLYSVSVADDGDSVDSTVDLTVHTRNGGTAQAPGQLCHLTYIHEQQHRFIDIQ